MYPYGNPQYPGQQNQIYPQVYNPNNAPPSQQPTAPGYQVSGQNPQYNPYQPGFTYSYPGQPPVQGGQQPAAMSYPGIAPTAPLPVASYGYPGAPNVAPTDRPMVEWIPSTPQHAPALSDRAIIAGYEGHDNSPLWVIRSRFQNDLIPGKLAIKHQAAYVAWGGDENAVQSIEVCCARPEKVRWVPSSDGAVPPNAVIGGNTSQGEPLYVGRARHEGSLTPGKVHPSHKAMYISFAGKEHPHKSYEVLCCVPLQTCELSLTVTGVIQAVRKGRIHDDQRGGGGSGADNESDAF